MQIGIINSYYNNYSSNRVNLRTSNPAFCGNTPEKLIKKIMSAQNIKNVHLTFDEASKIYRYLGYDVLMKRGSHAVIPITKTTNLPLVIPHKEKYIAPMDIKRLKYVINGDIEKALNC